jgi:branched-chain amino acid transport system ATP-binding protein
MLKVANIHSYYGSSHILEGISLEVIEGETVCLLGRNGAGKTTTMKSIMGIVHPAGGKVEFQEKEITGKEPHVIARLGIGYVPEDRRIFPQFTVEENLRIGSRKRGGDGWNLNKIFQLFPHLSKIKGRLGAQLSGGEQQMLTIARTLMGNPQLLLLDEPSEGLAPLIVLALREAVNKIKRQGLSILLSEQNVRFSMKVSDRAYVIDGGRIMFQGTFGGLLESEQEVRRYLVL